MPHTRISDFDYDLAPERIAQAPANRRDQSRLMVLNRAEGRWIHARFHQVGSFLAPGDLLVFNDTRVVSARLKAKKETGGSLEVFLLRHTRDNRWEALIRGKVSPGTLVVLESGEEGRVESCLPQGTRMIRFPPEMDLAATMERHGAVPLPHYIRRDSDWAPGCRDAERYQTVYAKRPGAVAAPTAGLHFTKPLLEAIRQQGVETTYLTLHVGYGTFKPVTVTDIREHRMDREVYDISEETAAAINRARSEGRRVIAVGTTTTRTLESAVNRSGRVASGPGASELFIYPGYEFKVIQGLITNFHLPRSTLLMLVSALAGRGLVQRAYEEAAAQAYRFYSYGDAMLIL